MGTILFISREVSPNTQQKINNQPTHNLVYVTIHGKHERLYCLSLLFKNWRFPHEGRNKNASINQHVRCIQWLSCNATNITNFWRIPNVRVDCSAKIKQTFVPEEIIPRKFSSPRPPPFSPGRGPSPGFSPRIMSTPSPLRGTPPNLGGELQGEDIQLIVRHSATPPLD